MNLCAQWESEGSENAKSFFFITTAKNNEEQSQVRISQRKGQKGQTNVAFISDCH